MDRRKNRFVEELHLNDPDLNPTRSELLLERSAAKERELGSTKMEPSSSIEETHAKQLENSDESSVQVIQKKLFQLKKGSGMTFLLVNISEDILLKPKSQICHEIGTSL